MKKIVTIGSIVVFVAVAAFLVLFNSNKEEESSLLPADSNQVEEPVISSEEEVKITAMDDPSSIYTELEDLTEQGVVGGAYIVRIDGKLYHHVSANLNDPPEGQVYEGWLVRKEPSLDFFSTGVMKRTPGGRYELTYKADQPYDVYNDVVITLESKVDEIPEEHVLEGSFDNPVN
jgi:hypothetical protein